MNKKDELAAIATLQIARAMSELDSADGAQSTDAAREHVTKTRKILKQLLDLAEQAAQEDVTPTN